MNVYLTTLGCRLNEAEVETWSREIEDNGHAVVGHAEAADVMVVNTCAVTNEASRKSRKFLGSLHRQNPEARLVVTGCYSELEPRKAAEQIGVDMVVRNADKDRLVELIGSRLDAPVMPLRAAEPDSVHAFREVRTRAFIKVQDGCKNRCTFCIVTIARGQERSRPVDEIVREINILHNRGYQEMVLTGVHLGGYGSDLGCDLVTLVEAILRDTTVPRIRLSSLEPWDLPDGFARLWQNKRLMPHLHLPLQSGSDSVLRRMARRCPTERYRTIVEDLRSAISDFVLTTDIIVGFPGETQQEWNDSLSFVRDVGFAHMHVFAYSPRTGTAAARLPGQLPSSVKKHRSREMHAIAAEMKRAHFAAQLGRTRPVLWEKAGPLEDGRHHYSGYTDNYLRAETTVPATSASLENRITDARLTAISDRGDTVLASV